MIPTTETKRLCVLYRQGELDKGPLAYRKMTADQLALANEHLAETAPVGIWVDHEFFETLIRGRNARNN